MKGAWVSHDGLYRYRLQRRWGSGGRMVFILLNPSTADAKVDDRTTVRCIGYAKREGCGAMEIINLYALRATKPIHLLDHPDPEGPENPMAWAQALFDTEPALIVAGWGAQAGSEDLPASKALRGYASGPMMCLGTTKEGSPRHPLYLKADQPLMEWA